MNEKTITLIKTMNNFTNMTSMYEDSSLFFNNNNNTNKSTYMTTTAPCQTMAKLRPGRKQKKKKQNRSIWQKEVDFYRGWRNVMLYKVVNEEGRCLGCVNHLDSIAELMWKKVHVQLVYLGQGVLEVDNRSKRSP